MSKSSMTVRNVFELPDPGADGSEGWNKFEDGLSKEVKGIKTAALPDVAEKVAELFEIPIPDIFLTSWKKAESIKALLDESRQTPETVMDAELAKHKITSQHHPHIEIRIQNKTVKKLEFVLKLVFELKGFVLKIQDGAIRGMKTGECEVSGKLEYQGLVIAEKKPSRISFPGSVSFESVRIESQQKAAEPKAVATKEQPAATVPSESRGARKTIEEVAEPQRSFTTTPEIPKTSVSLGEVKEHKAPPVRPVEEIVAPTLPDPVISTSQRTSGPVQQFGDNIIPPVETPSQETGRLVGEERMTWEVGDPEDFATTPQQTANTNSIDAKTVETTHDLIDRMSRKIVDGGHTGSESPGVGHGKALS